MEFTGNLKIVAFLVECPSHTFARPEIHASLTDSKAPSASSALSSLFRTRGQLGSKGNLYGGQ